MNLIESIEQKQLDVLACGGWGTINAHSVSVAAALAKHVGAEHALLCHSENAAYEALLRHFGAAYGRRIAVGATCVSADALVPVCVGAMPLFVPVCERCGMIAPDQLELALSSGEDICCVVVDLIAQNMEIYPLARISEICRAHQTPLILNAGGCFSLRNGSLPLCDLADAVLYSLERGSEIYAGKGGLVATSDQTVYAGAFAYHNCGRSFGDGCSLDVDALIGGDLRVTEWTSVVAEAILENKAFSVAAPLVTEHMAVQPVFRSEYALKMTGIRLD